MKVTIQDSRLVQPGNHKPGYNVTTKTSHSERFCEHISKYQVKGILSGTKKEVIDLTEGKIFT